VSSKIYEPPRLLCFQIFLLFGVRCTYFTSSCLSTNMDWSSDCLQSILGQIIGDPTHRLGCRWVDDNGVCCQNPVSKDSRINGAICLKMFQDLPTGHPPKTRLSEAARYMLCPECRRHSSRPRKCAQRWMDRLYAQASQMEETTQSQKDGHWSVSLAQHWPTSLCYEIGTTGTFRRLDPDDRFL
jgi:hypothetical protein